MGNINYRAVHTKALWRKVQSHQSLETAINGKDGAAGLFAGKARIDYDTHGQPLYVVVWQDSAQSGFVVKHDPSAPNGIRRASVPVSDLMEFERQGQASTLELEAYFLQQ